MRACQSIYTKSLARPCRDHWKETGEIAKARWREGIESRLKKTRAPLSDPLSGIFYPFPLLLRQTNGLPPIFLPSPARPTSDVYYNDARRALSETPILFWPSQSQAKGFVYLRRKCTTTVLHLDTSQPTLPVSMGKKSKFLLFSVPSMAGGVAPDPLAPAFLRSPFRRRARRTIPAAPEIKFATGNLPNESKTKTQCFTTWLRPPSQPGRD